MYELTVELSFSAAHCLPEHPGRCARLHGHSYRALIAVAGARLNAQGMLMDFADLKARCERAIAPLDHSYLNELPAFAGFAPTAEAIAQHLYRELAAQLAEVKLARVTVYESDTSFVTYWE